MSINSLSDFSRELQALLQENKDLKNEVAALQSEKEDLEWSNEDLEESVIGLRQQLGPNPKEFVSSFDLAAERRPFPWRMEPARWDGPAGAMWDVIDAGGRHVARSMPEPVAQLLIELSGHKS